MTVNSKIYFQQFFWAIKQGNKNNFTLYVHLYRSDWKLRQKTIKLCFILSYLIRALTRYIFSLTIPYQFSHQAVTNYIQNVNEFAKRQEDGKTRKFIFEISHSNFTNEFFCFSVILTLCESVDIQNISQHCLMD